MIVELDIDLEDIVDAIKFTKPILDSFLEAIDAEVIVQHFDPCYSELIEHMDAKKLFEAIDAHVKGGTDPQFNQAYNKWRYNK